MNYKLKSKIGNFKSGELLILAFVIAIFCSVSILGVTEEQTNGKTEQPDNKDTNNPPDSGKTEERDKILDDLDKELKPIPVEEEVDVISILNKVVDKMESAEDRLSTASNLDSDEHKIDDPNRAKKRQEEAINEINKIFRQIKKLQSDATDGLDKVIRSVKVIESQGQGKPKKQPKEQNQKPKPKPEPKPKPQEKEEGKEPGRGPAPRAYDAKGNLPDGFTPRRSDALKWGNLPPKLRDEIIQSAQEEFLPEYQERLIRYFKILAGKE
jgi:hypothetical protein